eukprot:387020-Pyramimonas_sp.AAC.1
MLACYNIHNFGFPSEPVDSLIARIVAETQVAAQCPERVTVLVLGDFNFSVEVPMHLHVPEIDKGLLVQPRLREHGASWWLTLSDLTEIDP